MHGHVEEHCRVWLSVTFYRHGTHSVLLCLLIQELFDRATSLFCSSLGPHIKALIEHAVWNCKRQMHPVTYLGAQIVPMLCEFPQYMQWGLIGQPTLWLEEWLCMADLHIGQAFMCPCNEYVLCIALILHYCSCCVPFTIFCFLLLIFYGVIMQYYIEFVLNSFFSHANDNF